MAQSIIASRTAVDAEIVSGPQQSPALTAPPAPKLVNQRGEIDVSKVPDPKERLQLLNKIFPPDQYNILLKGGTLMAKIHEAVTLWPIVVDILPGDLWDPDACREMKLPKGHTTFRAEKLFSMINAFGGDYRVLSHREIEVGGIPQLEVEARVVITLPNGENVQATGSKTETIHNYDRETGRRRGVRAHVFEMTKTKAIRNAAKKLFGIPTSLPVKEATRLHVFFRPVFDRSLPEGRAAAREIEETRGRAEELLYGKPVIDASVEDYGQNAVAYKVAQDMMMGAKSLENLDFVGSNLPDDLSDDDLASLRKVYTARRAELKDAQDGAS